MERSGVVSILVFLVVAVFGVAVTVVIGPDNTSTIGWRAFDLVVTPADTPQDEVYRRLRDAGFEPLNMSNATLRIEDFNGHQEIAVSAIAERFDSKDPRLDPFVQQAKELFAVVYDSQQYLITYLPRPEGVTSSSAGRYRAIREALGDIPFYATGRQPISPIVPAITVLGILIGVVVVSRRRVILSLAIALTAAVYVLRFGVTAVFPATITAIVAVYATIQSESIEREWLLHHGPVLLGREQALTIAAFVGGIAISVVSITLDQTTGLQRGILGYVGFLGTIGGWYGIAIICARSKFRRSEHRLFSPRPILGDPWRRRIRGPELFPGLTGAATILTVGLGILFFFNIDGSGTDLYVPTPDHLLGEPPVVKTPSDGSEVLRALGAIDPWNTPLSTTGFFAHRWFQESLLYGGEYETPVEGGVVSLQRFARVEGRIESRQEELLRTDGMWIIDSLDTSPHSVYSVFSREGGVFTVVEEPLGVATIPREYVTTHALLLFLFVLPLLFPIRLPYRSTLGTVAVASRSERR